MSQCEHLILYTQFFVRHWLVLVEEPHVSQGSGQHLTPDEIVTTANSVNTALGESRPDLTEERDPHWRDKTRSVAFH